MPQLTAQEGNRCPNCGDTRHIEPIMVTRECPECAASWVEVYEYGGYVSLETPESAPLSTTILDIVEYTYSARLRCQLCHQEVEIPTHELPTTHGGTRDPRWFTCPSCSTLATIQPQ